MHESSDKWRKQLSLKKDIIPSLLRASKSSEELEEKLVRGFGKSILQTLDVPILCQTRTT